MLRVKREWRRLNSIMIMFLDIEELKTIEIRESESTNEYVF